MLIVIRENEQQLTHAEQEYVIGRIKIQRNDVLVSEPWKRTRVGPNM